MLSCPCFLAKQLTSTRLTLYKQYKIKTSFSKNLSRILVECSKQNLVGRDCDLCNGIIQTTCITYNMKLLLAENFVIGCKIAI